jgi:hypothetical protein
MPLDKAERAYILARLERFHTLFEQIETMTYDRQMRKLLRRELVAAKKAVKQLATRRARFRAPSTHKK